MRTLARVRATPEQLPIISRVRPGTELIRGAAGSGKTTTALLRLRSLIGFFASRKRRLGDQSPVRALVLTYNRTLRGYITALIAAETGELPEAELTVATFGQWSYERLDMPIVLDDESARARIRSLGVKLGLDSDFLTDEVDYALGRFLPTQLSQYLTANRIGRGRNPRLPRTLRERILTEVIEPYQSWKVHNAYTDWNDLAVALSSSKHGAPVDVVVADETQDFSANQVRAILNQVAEVHSVTFVLDAAQRIYARGFQWNEVNLVIRPENVHRLTNNYRNTIEIAKFAAPLVQGLQIDDDGTVPDFNTCVRSGPKPIVIEGRFRDQIEFAVQHLGAIDLANESVAFLQPKGGGWFDTTRSALVRNHLSYVEISRQSEWPEGNENIALSTLHSAKGLEFDHVVILGLNAEITPHGAEEDDDRLSMFRRLLAMGIGRARKSVLIGYKAEEASKLISYLDASTYDEVVL